MRDYLNIIIAYYCVICWVVFVWYFIDNYKRHKKEYGYLWFPTIAVTTIFAPGFLIVSIVVDIIKWLLRKN